MYILNDKCCVFILVFPAWIPYSQGHCLKLMTFKDGQSNDLSGKKEDHFRFFENNTMLSNYVIKFQYNTLCL